MDRRERRRRARERKKIEEKLRKQGLAVTHAPHGSNTAIGNAKNASKHGRARGYLARVFSSTKTLAALILSAMTLLGGFVLFPPHVSIDPQLLLDPGDPFSTQFSVSNESLLFDATNLQPSCRTIDVLTSHDVGLFGLPPRPSPPIPTLGPREKTTIVCPPWTGGLGAGAGNVLVAYIEIDVSYRQNWWPFEKQQRFPFKGARDSQNGVHWTHLTPDQLQAELSRATLPTLPR